MILSTLYTQKYSIIQILWSAVLVVVLYVNYLQNEQIKSLNKKIEELSTNSTEIIQRLADKEKELDILINKISTTQVDTLLITQNNENIKLYLLIAGGVVLCASGFYIFNNIFQIFSLKKIIPVSFYSIIQDFTPFFQTKSTYFYTDKINRLDVLAEVINEKKINISVKEFDSNDFINLTDYIYKLQFHSYNYTATTLTNSSDVLLSSAEAIENLSKFL